MQPVEIRSQLVEALRLDLIGPDATAKLGAPDEVLPQSPSRWYLTGFLVPLDAGEEQRAQEGSDEELDEMNEAGGGDDATTPEPAAARRAYMPSSIGMSILLPDSARRLTATVRWGDYKQVVSGQSSVVRDGEESSSRKLTTDNFLAADASRGASRLQSASGNSKARGEGRARQQRVAVGDLRAPGQQRRRRGRAAVGHAICFRLPGQPPPARSR
jgi:hypothetical protein